MQCLLSAQWTGTEKPLKNPQQRETPGRAPTPDTQHCLQEAPKVQRLLRKGGLSHMLCK